MAGFRLAELAYALTRPPLITARVAEVATRLVTILFVAEHPPHRILQIGHVESLRAWLTENLTPYEVRCAILAGVSRLHHDPTPSLEITDRIRSVPLLCQAVLQQNAIGWHNFVKGFVAQEFATIIFRTPSRHPKAHSIRKHWTTGLNAELWSHFEAHWTLRNKDTHGHTPEEEQHLALQRCHCTVDELYARAAALSPRNQDILSRPIDEVKEMSLSLLQNWLRIVIPTVDACLLAEAEVIEPQRRITEFFNNTESAQ